MKIESRDSCSNIERSTQPGSDLSFYRLLAALKIHAGQHLWSALFILGLLSALSMVESRPVTHGGIDAMSDHAPLAALMRSDKVRFYAAPQEKPLALPTAVQINRFSEALLALRAYDEQSDPRLLDKARGLLRSVMYQLIPSTDGYWYIRDRLPERGWGSYAVNRSPADRLLVEVPRPLDEAHAMEAGVAMFYETGARALAVAGAMAARSHGIDVLASRDTFFHAFHRIHAHDSVLAVRGTVMVPAESRGWTPGGVSRLWVNKNLPAAIDIKSLKALVGTLVVIWKAPPAENLQRRTTPGAYVELYLNGDDAGNLVAHLENRSATQTHWQADGVKKQLDEWLLTDEAASPDGKSYVPSPNAAQLAFFDREVFGPLLRVAGDGYKRGKWSTAARAQLRAIHYVALGMGYGVTRLRDTKARQEYLVLHRAQQSRGNHEQYVFRAGGGDDYAVNVPDAEREPKALEYGLTLFHSLKARALLVADETREGSAKNKAGIAIAKIDEGVFRLANQVLRRELGGQAFMVVISRGPAQRIGAPIAKADVSLALADGTMSPGEATPLTQQLLSVVQRSGLSYRFVDATKGEAGRHGRIVDSEVATLWLSPQASIARGSVPRAPVGPTKSAAKPALRPIDDAPVRVAIEPRNNRTTFIAFDSSQ